MIHWTDYLPEFGKHHLAESVKKQRSQIEMMYGSIANIEKDIAKDEEELMKVIKISPDNTLTQDTGWNEDEIRAAKKMFRTQNPDLPL